MLGPTVNRSTTFWYTKKSRVRHSRVSGSFRLGIIHHALPGLLLNADTLEASALSLRERVPDGRVRAGPRLYLKKMHVPL